MYIQEMFKVDKGSQKALQTGKSVFFSNFLFELGKNLKKFVHRTKTTGKRQLPSMMKVKLWKNNGIRKFWRCNSFIPCSKS